jgi:hypothetical protein
MNKKKSCVWCWFKTFNEFLSWWEICEVCNYQDSIMWLFYPFDSDANWWLTLIDYQEWTLKNIWCKVQEYKKWKSIYYRDKNWRPINIDNFNKNYDYYPKYFFDTIVKSNSLFYNNQLKAFQEAQKYNPDEKVHLDC